MGLLRKEKERRTDAILLNVSQSKRNFQNCETYNL